MQTTAQKIRGYRGPPVLSLGLRPFFLGAAIWAALIVAIWLPLLAGTISIPSLFSPIEWHVHELIFGYLPAVMVGFLLTAIPNWTGRLPVVGAPLLALFLLWLSGRAAIAMSVWIGALAAAIVDLAFLVVFIGLMAREIFSSKNRKNARLLVILSLFVAANGLFHLQAATGWGDGQGLRLGLGAAIVLITVIGGRVVPSFTRNWLARHKPESAMPVTFDRFDGVAIGAGVVAMAGWVIAPNEPVTALLFVLAFALHLMRLSRWRGIAAFSQAIVLILHVAYLFIPIGFALMSVSILFPEVLGQAGALHAWTAGAIGLMTLAIMTRAALGHTGRAIRATSMIKFIYLMAFCAAVLRLVAAFDIERDLLLALSAAAWVAAFGGFALTYWPILTRPRL